MATPKKDGVPTKEEINKMIEEDIAKRKAIKKAADIEARKEQKESFRKIMNARAALKEKIKRQKKVNKAEKAELDAKIKARKKIDKMAEKAKPKNSSGNKTRNIIGSAVGLIACFFMGLIYVIATKEA